MQKARNKKVDFIITVEKMQQKFADKKSIAYKF